MKRDKWINVYPQGTKEGDEELAVFIALTRNKQAWRTVAAISVETNLPAERIEEIINKYYKLNMILPHDTKDDYWGYWERIPEDNLPKKQKSILEKDHEVRMNKSK